MAKQTKKSKVIKPSKASKKKKKFSTTDYVAFAILALILTAIIGVTGYYYGIHRPHASGIVRERAEQFTETYFDIDYNRDLDVEAVSAFLTGQLANFVSRDAESINRNRKVNETMAEVHEVESEVVDMSLETARVRVKFKYTESTITKEPTTAWGIVYLNFRKVGNEWLIERYITAPKPEVDELNEQRG